MALTADASPSSHRGIRIARVAGTVLGLVMVAVAIRSLAGGAAGFDRFQQLYWIACGLLLATPFSRLRADRLWFAAFAALIVVVFGFVFVTIVSVMFDYIAAAERNERLGVPGLEGTCIFLTLMQIPAVLFQRRPDMLD